MRRIIREGIYLMELICATPSDYEAIRDFYYDLIDAMEHYEYSALWQKDTYPSQEFLKNAIHNHEVYIARDERVDAIMVCMVVNHSYNEGYKKVRWSIDASDDELLVIHTLGVGDSYAGRGLAKQAVTAVINMAREQGIKTIRMDVLEHHMPAQRAYEKIGFRCAETVNMFYEDTGWTNFKMYEYLI